MYWVRCMLTFLFLYFSTGRSAVFCGERTSHGSLFQQVAYREIHLAPYHIDKKCLVTIQSWCIINIYLWMDLVIFCAICRTMSSSTLTISAQQSAIRKSYFLSKYMCYNPGFNHQRWYNTPIRTTSLAAQHQMMYWDLSVADKLHAVQKHLHARRLQQRRQDLHTLEDPPQIWADRQAMIHGSCPEGGTAH